MKNATVLGLWWQGAAVLSAALVVDKNCRKSDVGLLRGGLMRRFDGLCCHYHCGGAETRLSLCGAQISDSDPIQLGNLGPKLLKLDLLL